VVIGNELHSRKYQVVFVSRTQTENTPPGDRSSGSDSAEYWLKLSAAEVEGGKEIEVAIVDHLVKMHLQWISG
jgi:phosphopantothenate-cysteine ligase